jgi:hypothetical protein
MLFDDQKRVLIDLPTAEAEGKPTLAFLIGYLCKNVMKDTRKELFVLDDHMCVLLFPLSAYYICLPFSTLLLPSPLREVGGRCSMLGPGDGDEVELRLDACSQALIVSVVCLWLT